MKFQFGEKLLGILGRPTVVFWICLSFIAANVVFDGTIYQIWSLFHHKNQLSIGIKAIKEKNRNLTLKIRQANRPEFIEKAARDQLDLVAEGDLLFVFPDSAEETAIN